VSRNDQDMVYDETGVTERWAKCLDAAAVRIGFEPDLVSLLMMQMKRRREDKASYDNEERGNKRYKQSLLEFSFLINNIGLVDEKEDYAATSAGRRNGNVNKASHDHNGLVVIEPEMEALERLTDDEKRIAFQAFYKRELQRQRSIFQTQSRDETVFSAPQNGTEDELVTWVDG
jgi:hypothetical protein